MVKISLKLASFSKPAGDAPGFKPAMPGTKEAEEYAASAEAQAQAAPFSSASLKRKPTDDVGDAPPPKRINSGEAAEGTAPPPVSRPSIKFTFKAKPPVHDAKPVAKVDK